MSTHPAPGHNQPVTARFHRRFYQSIGLLVLWLVISVWLLFNRGSYMNLTVVVITGFFFILTAIPFMIWRSWRRARTDEAAAERDVSFRDWSHWDIETWTGRLSGREAAIQALLPIAAVAIGMTVFGLVLAFTLPTLGYQ